MALASLSLSLKENTMPSFIIKRGGIWASGKLHTEGDVVELSDKDRDAIDPHHVDLQSSNEAKAEAEKLAAAAKEAAEKSKSLAEKSKDGAK